METRIEKAYFGEKLNDGLIDEAGRLIRSGELVAFPTETVYGLGGDALNGESAKKIYEAKGRPSDNPLIVHIADLEALPSIVRSVPEKARILTEAFWPGPLTLIFEKSDKVPYQTTGGLDTVAVRMPVNEAARAVIRASGGYIAAPSANRSGRPSCTEAVHVYEDLKGRIPLIIDGGKSVIGLESTIVDLTGDVPCMLRPGYISISQLMEKVGEVDRDPAVDGSENGGRPKAPGMKYKHYAPKGELYLVKGERDNVVRRINAMAALDKEKGLKTAVIASDETLGEYRADIVTPAGSRENEETIANRLFAILRQLDSDGADVIYSEEFNTPMLGEAIMNRLIRAAGHREVNADDEDSHWERSRRI